MIHFCAIHENTLHADQIFGLKILSMDSFLKSLANNAPEDSNANFFAFYETHNY